MPINLTETKAYLDQLDLTYIVDAMCSDTYSLPRWVKEEAQHCARLYKNFLWLNKKYHPATLVPTREIDEFWHNHILYTKNYVQDCAKIFGFYFHHAPSTPEEDPQRAGIPFCADQRIIFKRIWHPIDFN